MIIESTRNLDAYEKFKRYGRVTDADILSWRSVDGFEIVARMVDGSLMRFNSFDCTIGYLKEHEVDERGNYLMGDEEYRQEFAMKLKRLMHSARITQTMLSEYTGISQVSISKYLNGKTLPDCRNLTRIANALRCSITELTYFE